ncbi:MAG: MFS transporter [Planctomycetota bacterium]|nr:MFS transporter [Planctomycetota bacterium]
MALADNRFQRVSTLCVLYLAQGIPWGFMTITLANYLSKQGLDSQQVGELTATTLLPWTFKIIWAPVIDSIQLKSMGKRRPWILLAQLLMTISLVAILWAEPYMFGDNIDIELSYRYLLVVFFIHNVFAVLQDVCTDAMAVDILPANEQGRVNGLMWASKLLGLGGGGALLATIMNEYGIRGAVIAQMLTLFVIMLFPLFFIERKGEKRFPWSKGNTDSEQPTANIATRPILEIVRDLIRGFSLRTTAAYALMILVSLIGWGVMEVVLKTICNQQIKWSAEHTSHVMGYAVIPECIVAITAGWLGDRYGRKLFMTIGLVGYGMLSIGFALLASQWGTGIETTFAADGVWDNHIVWIYTVSYRALLAVFVVNYLADSMKLSWTNSSATMFTIYMTLSNIGHVIGNYSAGSVEKMFGRADTFIAMGLLTASTSLILLLVNTKDVESRKAVFEGLPESELSL